MTPDQTSVLNEIIGLASKIVGKGKTGSALEAHEIKLLWDLGEVLQKYCNGRPLHTVIDTLEKEWFAAKHNKFDLRLYKGALTVRAYWSDKKDYLTTIKSLNTWGKLREVVPLSDIALKPDAKISRQDIQDLIQQANGRTYPEVRDLVRVLRFKGDPIFEELGIDIYELHRQLYDIADNLFGRLLQNDKGFIDAYRKNFSEKTVLEFRKCLSGIQNEEVYAKYKPDIKEFAQKKMTAPSSPDLAPLAQLIEDIARLAASEAGRTRIREEFGMQKFGDLSTYLKAFLSDGNRDKFMRDQEVLKKFLGGMQG